MEFSDIVYYFFHDNIHFVLEFSMVILLAYVIMKKPKYVEKTVKLTADEIEEIVSDWNPKPLHRETSDQQKLDSKVVVIDEVKGHNVIVDGKEAINLAAINPFGLLGDKELEESAIKALNKYGCGSCGPRGFYGTIDVHLKLEEELADFMGCEKTILYSSGFATVASAIPTFAKRGDLIYSDQGVNHAVQTGISLSRSTVHYFAHNDIAALARLLEKHSKADPKYAKRRKFIVVEGLYINHGDVVPLKKLLELKDRFCCYLIVDESYSLGVLGKTGGGICELFNVPRTDIDIATGNLGNAICSIGGFCSGNNTVVTHQRLNGSGYVFSASLPPYLSCVASAALHRLRTDNVRRDQMLKLIKVAHRVLKQSKVLQIVSGPESPIIHARWTANNCSAENQDSWMKAELCLQAVVDEALSQGVVLTRGKYVADEKFRPPPSLRICVPASLSSEAAEKALQIVVDVAQSVASKQ